MGLVASEIIKIMNIAKSNGIKEKTLAMIGKQDLYIEWESFAKTLILMGLLDVKDLQEFKNMKKDSVNFFLKMGFKEVHAVDYSDYEGADIICDLNKEIPPELHQRFDYVIQGGTIEHVFDIAMAMKNVSDMVKVGGIIYHGAPSDGWINHGFYSISPTFFTDYYKINGFEVLSIEMMMKYFENNGEIQRCCYTEDLRLLFDSKVMKYGTLNNALPLYNSKGLFNQCQVVCFAKRIEETESIFPIQGAYDALYKRYNNKKNGKLNEDKIKEYMQNDDKKVALYGCGHMCDLFLDEIYRYDLEDYIKIIFDSNIRKAGEYYRGFKVVYPTEKKLEDNYDILITSVVYAEEIKTFLRDKGVSENKITVITEFMS